MSAHRKSQMEEVHGNDQSVIRGLDTDRIMDRREGLLSKYVNHRKGVTIVLTQVAEAKRNSNWLLQYTFTFTS